MNTLVQNLSADQLDAVLDKYLVILWKAGEPPEAARYAVYAAAWTLTLPTRSPLVLPLAKASLRGFEKRSPNRSRDPGPWEAAIMMSAAQARLGTLTSLYCAAFNLLTFDLYLRPSEMLNLRRTHVLPPSRGPGRLWAAIVCPSSAEYRSKTGQQDDTVLLALHCRERAWLGEVLKALHQGAARPDG